MVGEAPHVVAPPAFGVADGDRARALGLEELHAAGIGKGFLRRIDDLHHMAAGAVRRQIRDRAHDLCGRAPQIAQNADLVARTRDEERRQALRRAGRMNDRLRHALDHGAVGGRPHHPGDADAFAAAHEQFAERESEHERAVALRFPHQGRSEFHRRRKVGPDPDRMRRLPFALAHIEMVVARRAPPVDAARGLARHEAAILPKILARPGAPPSVQAVKDRGRYTPGLEYEPWHRGDEAKGGSRRGANRSVVASVWRTGVRLAHAILAFSLATTPSMVSPSARAPKVSAMRCLSTGSASANTSSIEGASRPSRSARARTASISA